MRRSKPRRCWSGCDTSEGVFVNTEHDTTPIMVHFNGGKTNFLPVARHLARRRPPRRRRVRRDETSRPPTPPAARDEPLDDRRRDVGFLGRRRALTQLPAMRQNRYTDIDHRLDGQHPPTDASLSRARRGAPASPATQKGRHRQDSNQGRRMTRASSSVSVSSRSYQSPQ